MGPGWGLGNKSPLPPADLQVCPHCPQWKQNKNALLENSQRVTTALLARSEISVGDRQLPPSAATMNSRCFQQLDEGYDEEYGGFAEAPKFPTPGQYLMPGFGLLIPVLVRDFLAPGFTCSFLSS